MYLILDLDLIRSGYDRQVRLDRVVCCPSAEAAGGGNDIVLSMCLPNSRQSMSRCRTYGSRKEDPFFGSETICLADAVTRSVSSSLSSDRGHDKPNSVVS